VGLGPGAWGMAHTPIPNPQSPNLISKNLRCYKINFFSILII
jgi:hypothetical protein